LAQIKRATRGDCKHFAAKNALQALQPWHRENAHIAPVAEVNFMNYEGQG
jgi:hypothetical protein